MKILSDPGMKSFNREAAEIFSANGAEVTHVSSGERPYWILKIPERLVLQAIDDAPKVVKLGARNIENTVILNGEEPRVHFFGCSEPNIWLDVDFETYTKKSDPGAEVQLPVFRPRRANILDICKAAHVYEYLETVDLFARTANVMDNIEITKDNKDVNVLFASFNNTTKHVCTGVANTNKLGEVKKMAEIVAGGPGQLKENPIISFVLGPVNSPLAFIDETTQQMIEIARMGLPILCGPGPQAGTTAPVSEAGMTVQMNAEVLAIVALTQLVNKGTPVVFGNAPVIARMDTLVGSCGAPETSQYDIDFVQLARFYKLPCAPAAGPRDAKAPGIQASVQALIEHLAVALSGPQSVWFSWGFLDNNTTFCLLQAVLDDAHIQIIKHFLRSPQIGEKEISAALEQIRAVAGTPGGQYIRYLRPALRSGQIAPPYPFESGSMEDKVLYMANERMQQLLSKPVEHLSEQITRRIFNEIPGIMPKLNIYGK
jgi:trimethylamine--corrinoid protein Co-methyltransferase